MVGHVFKAYSLIETSLKSMSNVRNRPRLVNQDVRKRRGTNIFNLIDIVININTENVNL